MVNASDGGRAMAWHGVACRVDDDSNGETSEEVILSSIIFHYVHSLRIHALQ